MHPSREHFNVCSKRPGYNSMLRWSDVYKWGVCIVSYHHRLGYYYYCGCYSSWGQYKKFVIPSLGLIRSEPISDFFDVWLTGDSHHPQDMTSVCHWKLPQ